MSGVPSFRNPVFSALSAPQGVNAQAHGEQVQCKFLDTAQTKIRYSVYNGSVSGRDGKGRSEAREFRGRWGACEASEDEVRCFEMSGPTS